MAEKMDKIISTKDSLMRNLVTSLPEGLRTTLLIDWLSTKDISRLDCAFCNKELRSFLLETFRAESLILPLESYQGNHFASVPFLKWLNRRKIRVSTVKFGFDLSEAKGELLTEFLRISGTYLDAVDASLCGDVASPLLEGVAAYCANICELNLWSADSPTTALKFVLVNCKLLKRLIMRECRGFTGLSEFSDITCPSLDSLDLFRTDVTDQGIAAAMKACPALTGLCIAYCEKITSQGVREIGKYGKGLKYIDFGDNEQFGEAAIISVVKNCQQLVALDIYGCTGISSAAISEIARSAPQLRGLYLTDIEHVNDECLKTLASSCPDLHTLYINSLRLDTQPHVTDAGVVFLAQKLKGLKDMNFSGVQHLTDASLYCIAENCPLVNNIELDSIFNITDAGITALVKKCHQMEGISLRNCARVTSTGLALLATRASQLKYLVHDGLDDLHRKLWTALNPRIQIMADDTRLYDVLEFEQQASSFRQPQQQHPIQALNEQSTQQQQSIAAAAQETQQPMEM